MRNIFDQYTQPENKLTHALICGLEEDSRLLRNFVDWILGAGSPKGLKIVEQTLPGEMDLEEQDSERLGLPDAWIHDNESWSLLIESKVAAPMRLDQLERHLRTAKRRGFDEVTLLAVDVVNPSFKLPDSVHFKKWQEIYSWLARQVHYSDWANKIMQFFEAMERKWPSEGYLREGTLTEFTGINFDEENPYSYAEAKRLLRLMLVDLRNNPRLASYINTEGPGRAAITGQGQNSVWDYLRPMRVCPSDQHTRQPHFTLSILNDRLTAFLNVPNGLDKLYKNGLRALDREEFQDILHEVNQNMAPIVRSTPGSAPFARIMQRRYASQRSKPVRDALLEFDLRTAFSGEKDQKVKIQEQWLDALYSLIQKKRSNLEWAVGMNFPYELCPTTRAPEISGAVADSWLACRPLLGHMVE